MKLDETPTKGFEAIISPMVIKQIPVNDIASPTNAKRDGFRLKTKLDIKSEKKGTVLTKTVAFRIVVSFNETVKKTKCNPKKTLRIISLFAFFLTRSS